MANKKIKLEMTEAQLTTLVNIIDEYSAMLGSGDDDDDRIKWVKLVDRMLIINGIKRKYK